jgi:hypothetical protein
MNRYCLGRKFKVDGGWYWHCRYDGSNIKIDMCDGRLCPSCHRPVEVTLVEVDTRTVVAKEIRFKDGSGVGWLPFRTMIL